MKRLTLLSFLFVFFCATLHAQPFVQTVTDSCIAFVKTDRTQIWVKRPDTAAYVLFQADPDKTSHTSFTSMSHLSILDQTTDGSTMMIGGTFTFYPPWNVSAPTTWTGIISIRSDSINDFANQFSHVHFLLENPYAGWFRPLGAIYGDRKYFATFAASNPNSSFVPNVRFYRGSLDSSYNAGGATADLGLAIDSASVDFSNQCEEWHMTNLSVYATGQGTDADVNMVAAASSDVPGTYGFFIYQWHFMPAGNGAPKFFIYPYNNYSGILPVHTINVDTIFGMSIRAIDANYAELGFTNYNSSPDLHFYRFQYNSPSVLSFNDNSRGIDRQSLIHLPHDSEYFFAGRNTTSAYREDDQQWAQHGIGGDVQFSRWNSNLVTFITHETDQNLIDSLRPKRSGIYTADLSQGSKAQAKLVYNDTTAQELQPQFVILNASQTWFPGDTVPKAMQSFDFGTNDSGKAVASKTITVYDTSQKASTIIDSVVVHGNGAFTVTPQSALPYTMAAKSSFNITVNLNSKLPAGTKYDTVLIYSFTSVNPTIKVPLTGVIKSVATGGNSVTEVDPAVFHMSVMPNPFASAAKISLVAPEAGMMGIVVHDALGREVYASGLHMTGAGQSADFTFDAALLGLPAGAYYVTALLGDRGATREVVFAR